MSLQEITGILRNYFHLGIIRLVLLGLIICFSYFVVYKKILGGNKKPSKKQIVVGGLLIIYLIMVLGVTFLSRGHYYQGNMNLHFLYSYRQAWNTFNIRNWQFVILNIFMFVPLGFLLPLYHDKFLKKRWTLGAGLLFTLTIETLQLITGRGLFVLDDIFNNFLGAVIGYGLIMGLKTLFNSRRKRVALSVAYFSPLLIVILVFVSIFAYYHSKEFGNLHLNYNYKINMKNTTTVLNAKLNDQRKSFPIYQAPTYTKTTATDFAKDFFSNIQVDIEELEVIPYSIAAVYRVRDHYNTYNMRVNFLDGSYSFTDFSMHEPDLIPMETEEAVLIQSLDNFGIIIPEGASFFGYGNGNYAWNATEYSDDFIIDGSLNVVYYNDNTIKHISNSLVTYKKVRDVLLKSEEEAYKEILAGKFQYLYFGNTINSIAIHGVELSYQLDSKGFYQPVYMFKCTINDMETRIYIPALL